MKLVAVVPVLEKARNPRLIPKRVQVTRDGTTYMTTVWTSPGDEAGTFDLFDQPDAPRAKPEKAPIPVVKIDQKAAKDSEAARIGESKAEKKTDASLKRSRHDVMFEKPYTGKTGAKLLGYEWPHIKVEEVDKRGEDVVRRYSDWTQADISEMTGRKFVHKFIIQRTDGTVTTLSAESAAVALGISEAATRAKARKLLEDEIQNAKAKEKAKAAFEEYKAGPWQAHPADAIEKMDSGFRSSWIKKKDWGKQDREFKEKNGYLSSSKGREEIDLTYSPEHGYQALAFSSRNRYDSDMAARAGWAFLRIPAEEIWDENGNPRPETDWTKENRWLRRFKLDWYHKIEGAENA